MTVLCSETKAALPPTLESVTVFYPFIPQLMTGTQFFISNLRASEFESSQTPMLPGGKSIFSEYSVTISKSVCLFGIHRYKISEISVPHFVFLSANIIIIKRAHSSEIKAEFIIGINSYFISTK